MTTDNVLPFVPRSWRATQAEVSRRVAAWREREPALVRPRHPGTEARIRRRRSLRLKQWGASILLALALLAMVLA